MPIPFGGQERPARAVYESLASREREPFLCEARRVSEVTIPHLVPPEGYTSTASRKLATPWQSVGARGVNNLASKLLLSLFPPNTSFFKLVVLEERLAKAGATPEVRSEVEEALVAMEKRIQQEIELATFRPRAYEALRHLVVSGNAVMYVPDGQNWRVFHLDQFVVRRDSLDDKLRLLIVREEVMRAEVLDRLPEDSSYRAKTDDYVPLYTAVWWDEEEKTYRSVQEVGDEYLLDSEMDLGGVEQLPWIPLRLTTDEENYGRGIGADMLGDLIVTDALAEAITEGAAIASRAVGLLLAGSGIGAKDLNAAPNGSWLVVNNLEGARLLQADKARDFAYASNVLGEVVGRLSQAFLLHSSVQRNAERVTAEEIRFVAQELEDALGGVYSNLSQEFQLPLARRLMTVLTKRGVLPKLPKGLVAPTVVTGLEALGRGQEFSRLRLFLGSATETLGPDAMSKYLNPREVLSRMAVSLSVDTLNLVRPQEEVEQAERQAQAQAAIAALGPAAIQAAGKNPNVVAQFAPQQQ